MSLVKNSILLISLTGTSLLHAAPADVYVGFGVGQADIDTGVSGLTGTAALDEEDTSLKVFVGADIDDNFFIEGHYAELGEASLSGNNGDRFVYEGTTYQFTANNVKVTLEGESIGLAVGYKFKMGKDVDAFAKLGMHNWDATSNISTSAGSVSLSDDGTDKFFGFGVNYSITETMSLRAEYESFEFDSEDVDNMSLSLITRF